MDACLLPMPAGYTPAIPFDLCFHRIAVIALRTYEQEVDINVPAVAEPRATRAVIPQLTLCIFQEPQTIFELFNNASWSLAIQMHVFCARMVPWSL